MPSLFAAFVAADPSLPLITYYDDATGERTELSGATLHNWVSKTANLLVDGLGAQPGDRVAVWLPPHWQTAAVILGAWSAGLRVGERGPTDAEIAFAALPVPDGVHAPDRFALGLAPMGLPLRDVPDGWQDFVAEVRPHGDHFSGVLSAPADPALARGDGSTMTHGALLEQARRRAGTLRIDPGTRVLINAGTHPDPLDWLLAPLATGSRVVLCANADPTALRARAATEHAALLT